MKKLRRQNRRWGKNVAIETYVPIIVYQVPSYLPSYLPTYPLELYYVLRVEEAIDDLLGNFVRKKVIFSKEGENLLTLAHLLSSTIYLILPSAFKSECTVPT